MKYAVLAAALVYVFVLNNPRWAIPIRTGDFFNSIKLTFEHADTLWLLRTAFILGGFFLIILIPHFWCRYVCPTGGMLELLKKISIFKYVMTDTCNQCNVCQKACPVETRPSEINCTNCGDCTGDCPVEAITVKRGV